MNFWGRPKQLPPPGDWATWVTRYCDMLGALYYELAKEQADPRRWDEPTVAEIERQRRAALDLARLPERQIWRDKRLAMLVKAKRQAEQALGE